MSEWMKEYKFTINQTNREYTYNLYKVDTSINETTMNPYLPLLQCFSLITLFLSTSRVHGNL